MSTSRFLGLTQQDVLELNNQPVSPLSEPDADFLVDTEKEDEDKDEEVIINEVDSDEVNDQYSSRYQRSHSKFEARAYHSFINELAGLHRCSHHLHEELPLTYGTKKVF